MGKKKNERLREKAEELEALGWDALGFPEVGHVGDPDAAERFFREALHADPHLAEAYNGLGAVSLTRRRYAEAEAFYRTALDKARAELGTDKPQAFTWWGQLAHSAIYASSPWLRFGVCTAR